MSVKLKRPPRYPITEGGIALRRWIDSNGKTVPGFCEEHGLDRIQVQRAINGDRKRVSVDFAAEIERATQGHVSMRLWAIRQVESQVA